MTTEVKRTGTAYREVAALQATVVAASFDLEHYRNPHDRTAEFDFLNRKDPVRFGVAHFALLVPGFIRRMRHVPDRAVEYGEDDDGQYGLIECPCGSRPICKERLEKCPGCERYYAIDGKQAVVAYGNMTPPDEPEPEPIELYVCEHGTCDGSGFVVDEQTNTSYDCACRAALIAARRQRRS